MLGELRHRAPDRALVDVAVRVALLAVDLDRFRIFLPELDLIREELLAPRRTRPAVELIAEEEERLARGGSPVSDLPATPARHDRITFRALGARRHLLAILAEHVDPDERLELRIRRKATDVAHRRDDPRGKRMPAALDGFKDGAVHLELFHDALQVAITARLFGLEDLEDRVVRFRSFVRVFDRAFRVVPFLGEEDLPDEALSETLRDCLAFVLGALPSFERLRDLDLVAIARAAGTEEVDRGGEEFHEELRVAFLVPSFRVANLLELARLDAIDTGTDLFAALRERVREPVARAAERHHHDVILAVAVVSSGDHGAVLLGFGTHVTREESLERLAFFGGPPDRGVLADEEIEFVGFRLELVRYGVSRILHHDDGRLQLEVAAFLAFFASEIFPAMPHTDDAAHAIPLSSKTAFWFRPRFRLDTSQCTNRRSRRDSHRYVESDRCLDVPLTTFNWSK